MTRIKNYLTIICLFAIELSVAQDTLNKSMHSPNISNEENVAKENLFPASSIKVPTVINSTSFSHIKDKIIVGFTFLNFIFIIIIWINTRKKEENELEYVISDEIIPQLQNLLKKLESIESGIKLIKNNSDVAINSDIIEKIIKVIDDKKSSENLPPTKDILGNEQNPISENSKTKYPIRYFYLDLSKKGFKENSVVNKIYKCETLENDPNKAKFEINTLTDTARNIFFDEGELNNSICEIKGSVAPTKSIKTVKMGELKHIGNGVWKLTQPVKIEFS